MELSDISAGPDRAEEAARKRALLRLWLMLTAGIGVATFLFYRFVWAGTFATDNCRFTGCALGPALSALTSLAFAAGAALLIAILMQSCARYRQVFRFSRARLIGALVLAALTPLAILSGIPGILLMKQISIVARAFWTGAASDILAIPLTAAIFLVAVALTYPISCLLVTGLRKRLLRLAGFTLVWWSAYCLVLMLFGLRSVML